MNRLLALVPLALLAAACGGYGGGSSSGSAKFSFEAGKRYEMYCPVDGHKAQGMAGTISVGGAAGGGTTTNPEGETTTSGMPGY